MPASNTKTGAQKCVIQRVMNSADGDVRVRRRILPAADHEEVANVVDGHDHDHQAADHVDGAESIGALIGCWKNHDGHCVTSSDGADVVCSRTLLLGVVFSARTRDGDSMAHHGILNVAAE